MFYITMFAALALSFIAAANMLVDRAPNAKTNNGILGLVCFFVGIVSVLRLLLTSGPDGLPIVAIVHAQLLTMLGALFALDIIQSLAKTEQMDALVKKLTPFKGLLGLVIMGLSIYLLFINLKA